MLFSFWMIFLITKLKITQKYVYSNFSGSLQMFIFPKQSLCLSLLCNYYQLKYSYNRGKQKGIKMKDFGILILRVFSGFFMVFEHGLPKLLRQLSGAEIKFANPLGIGAEVSFVLTTFAEFFCSIFVVLGLFTRVSLIPLIIAMFVAGVVHHAPDPFAVKEKALLFLVIFVALFFTGAGKYSLSKFLPAKFLKL
jgi:putative oxidoreductase